METKIATEVKAGDVISHLATAQVYADETPELVAQRATSLSLGIRVKVHGKEAARLYREAARLYRERNVGLDAYRATRCEERANWCEEWAD